MELVSVRVAGAPSARDRVRLLGDVVYDDRPREPEQYWFDVPEKYAGSLSVSGNPWLACLLPLAVSRGEALRLCLPVDPMLLANASRLMQIWSGWHERLRPIRLEADSSPTDPGPGVRETGAFFSGGIDSFYMALRNDEGDRASVPRIDKLLCVWGFDIHIDATHEFQRLRSRLSEAADALGKELVDVATNLREVRFREVDWGRLSHGGALASVGLALERGFDLPVHRGHAFGWTAAALGIPSRDGSPPVDGHHQDLPRRRGNPSKREDGIRVQVGRGDALPARVLPHQLGGQLLRLPQVPACDPDTRGPRGPRPVPYPAATGARSRPGAEDLPPEPGLQASLSRHRVARPRRRNARHCGRDRREHQAIPSYETNDRRPPVARHEARHLARRSAVAPQGPGSFRAMKERE